LQSVMAARGYSGATISEIARAAGMRPGLIHYHFEDKRAILLALVARMAEIVEARYQARLAAAANDADGKLFAFVDAHVALGPDADTDAVAAWVAIGAEAIHQPEVQTIYAKVIADRITRLKKLFSDCLRVRDRSARGAGEMAAALTCAIEGTFQIASAAPGALPTGSAARALKAMAIGLLADTP
ncbi:MAG: TetR family transcriptional regulator, partial [Deltaproteobacteria bacterium]|nr:TetR family transcriptional regulator [Deltaproteobacteria bacterium]